ncbi:MAG: hypothetical protein IKV59_00275 [Lachnospiraceae bacterium]|nr:hypothetical protein [Lachnospiraceae bacterium]
MKRKFSEKGAVMVEAAIYMPLVLCTVMALIYLALFNMQEYMMMYQVQRVAAVAAREEAYIGYEYFGMGADQEIDFDWGEGNYPSAENVTAYYKEHSNKVSNMYRELTGWFTDSSGSYEGRFASAARDASLLALGNISSPEVEIDKGLLGTKVTVTITHSLPMPGVIRYLGLSEQFTLRTAAYTYSVNPADFVRNVDLAVDLTSYVLEKLGWKDNVNGFFDKTKEILGKIL